MEYAVISINSKQYIVKQGTVFTTDRVTVDTPIKVLGTGTTDSFDMEVDAASVKIAILEDKFAPKILVRRYKSKSRYRKEKGHKQPISILKIESISKGGKSTIVLSKTDFVEVEKSPMVVKPNESKRDIKIVDLDVSDRVKDLLKSEGYITAEDFMKATKEEILSIKGLGEKAYEKIIQSIS